MSLALFVLALVVSFLIVRMGAIAFEVTGLEWSLAKFQSLSCFTGTGFTTSEAELITRNPQRRRIASILMVLGNAGLVTLIATLANSLRTERFLSGITLPYVDAVFPQYLKIWMKLAVLIFIVYGIYKSFTDSRFARRLTTFLRKRMLSSEMIRHVSFEELVVTTGGYGISSIQVYEGLRILNKTLLEGRLRQEGITVLAIERHGKAIPNPPPDTKIIIGDRLICFGRLDEIRNNLLMPDKS